MYEAYSSMEFNYPIKDALHIAKRKDQMNLEVEVEFLRKDDHNNKTDEMSKENHQYDEMPF
jgi:hypothetical protein